MTSDSTLHLPQSIAVVVRKPVTGFGFTPFKYTLSDCARKKRLMNFSDLLISCDQAQVGLPIQAVVPDGAAGAAGVQVWDLITHVNGQDITRKKGKEVIELIKQVPIGEELHLDIIRSPNPPPAPVLKPVGSFSFSISDLFRLRTKKAFS